MMSHRIYGKSVVYNENTVPHQHLQIIRSSCFQTRPLLPEAGRENAAVASILKQSRRSLNVDIFDVAQVIDEGVVRYPRSKVSSLPLVQVDSTIIMIIYEIVNIYLTGLAKYRIISQN